MGTGGTSVKIACISEKLSLILVYVSWNMEVVCRSEGGGEEAESPIKLGEITCILLIVPIKPGILC